MADISWNTYTNIFSVIVLLITVINVNNFVNVISINNN